MAIVRWDPWRDLAAFERQLDQMMGRLGGGIGSGSREQRAWSPSLDVHQEGDTMVICAEVAGLDPEQVDISVEDDVLTISGSREDHDEVEAGQWIRRERYSGQFHRSVSLPPGVDPEQIQASARHGLIEIRVPRPAPVGARRVPLQTGGTANGGTANGGTANGGTAANGGQPIDVTSNAGANAASSDEGTVAAGIVPGTEEQAATTGISPGEAGPESSSSRPADTGAGAPATSGGGNP